MSTTAKFLIVIWLSFIVVGRATPSPNPNLSEYYEATRSIEEGVKYLVSVQDKEGFWSNKKMPALTALALTACLQHPDYKNNKALIESVEKGFAWLRKQQKEDGGIYGKGLASYNTSCSIMAFLALGQQADVPGILKARAFLINQQTDWNVKGKVDSQYDGGVGYGGSYPHSDMSNTYLAIEALKHSQALVQDDGAAHPKLDWDAALQFISRCQNLLETNDQDWASDDAENKGGFIYFPGDSKAGEQKLPDGSTALRSYGSMTYAGLLSLIHAELKADDPRVKAALEWLGRNYTLEENPGLGGQGVYYYYQTIAKALSAANLKTLPLKDNSEVNWRKELTSKLVSKQREDGSWLNENARWWENDPILVSSYAVLTLAQINAMTPLQESPPQEIQEEGKP